MIVTVLIDAELKADFHQAIVLDRACEFDFGDAWNAEAADRRLAAFPGGMLLGTLTDGPLHLTVERVQDGGETVDLRVWDHVVESSVELPSGMIGALGPLDEKATKAVDEIPAGRYRVRAAFRDFEADAGRARVQLWPDDAGKELVLATLGTPRDAIDAEYRRTLRAALGTPRMHDLHFAAPAFVEAYPEFGVLELAPAGPAGAWTYASTGGWRRGGTRPCEFLTRADRQERLCVELLAALASYDADSAGSLGEGSVIALGRPFLEGSRLDHVVLARAWGDEAPLGPLHLSGRHVDVLWAVLLTAEEAAESRATGAASVLDRLAGRAAALSRA